MCTWPEWIAALGPFAGAAAVVYAALVAKSGLNTWRKEVLGRRRIELAERGYSTFAKARGAIHTARNPLVAGTEMQEVVEVYDLRLTDAGYKPRIVDFKPGSSYYAPIHRLKTNREIFDQLHELEPLFAAHFGAKTVEHFHAFAHIHNRIVISAQALVREAQRSYSGAQATIQGYEKVIWYQGEDDEIVRTLDEATEAILALCREVIRAER